LKQRMNNQWVKKIIISLLPVVLGLLAGAVLMLLTGKNPIQGYLYLTKGGLMSIERIGNTLATATPMILSGLSIAFAFKTGLFNIGAAGQMLMGGLCATAVGLTMPLPRPVLIIVILLVSIVGGAIWGWLPGLLKAKFNVHEVVSTIMMNWISYWIVYYTVPAYFKGEFLETESRLIPTAASLKMDWLTNLFDGSYINLGLFAAIAAVVLISFILNKTVLGYELKAVGFNRYAAEYAGINVTKNIILSMMIAGGLAGLGGATLYLGNASNIQIGVLPSQGLDGIAVALLGLNSPYGAMFAAIFFGLLYSGKGFMNAMIKIPPEIADTIIASIIYFAATSVLIEKLVDRLSFRKKGA